LTGPTDVGDVGDAGDVGDDETGAPDRAVVVETDLEASPETLPEQTSVAEHPGECRREDSFGCQAGQNLRQGSDRACATGMRAIAPG